MSWSPAPQSRGGSSGPRSADTGGSAITSQFKGAAATSPDCLHAYVPKPGTLLPASGLHLRTPPVLAPIVPCILLVPELSHTPTLCLPGCLPARLHAPRGRGHVCRQSHTLPHRAGSTSSSNGAITKCNDIAEVLRTLLGGAKVMMHVGSSPRSTAGSGL